MTTVPRRIVFRVLADCLTGQARHLKDHTVRKAALLRGPAAGADAAAKQPGRRDHAADLVYQADAIRRWVGDPAYYQGAEVPAELLGHLAAMVYGRAESWPEVKRISGRSLEGIDWRDMPLVLIAILNLKESR